jgi:Transposase DDE domain
MRHRSQRQFSSRTRPRGFLAAWAQLIAPEAVPIVPRRRGRRPQIPLTQLLAALTFHVMQDVGTLREHFAEVFGHPLADSSWSDRRTRLPWEIFAELMRRVLRPRATRRRHPDAFWRGWRLVALDGTQFSLANTPQVLARRPKPRTRRGRAAFAKLPTTVLVEVGLHNPVAAAVGRDGESEWALALELLPQLPGHAVLLADRLYGCAAFAQHAVAACARVGSHLLVRARTSVKAVVTASLADGSHLIRVPVRAADRPHHVAAWLDLREIRVQVGRPGQPVHTLRLWTTLCDPTLAPALELAQLYARRWEHERYFRSLKRQLRKTALLQSHTVDTAAQEVAACVIASALLAQERAAVAGAEVPPLRISVAKVLRVVQALWLTIDLGAGILSEQQIHQILRRGQAHVRTQLSAPRRSRSCPRKVRQPITGWPRLLHNESIEGPIHVTVL